MAKEISSKTKKEPKEKQEISKYDVLNALLSTYGKNGDESNKDKLFNCFSKHLNQLIDKSGLHEKYNIVIHHDSNIMVKKDADKVYEAVDDFKEGKELLMVLFSRGGEAGSAYLIGKLCHEYSNGKFVVAVPRIAKSAATLLCCAANEVHMGGLSELGPIDPQIEGQPALGLKNSIEHIAELTSRNPKASEMFAKYLQSSVTPMQIGHYERVAESAMQYAENLLNTHKKSLKRSANDIADDLVYKYKDHGFVIDKAEAGKILGDNIIKNNTVEYELGNSIYQFLSEVEKWCELLDRGFYMIGAPNSAPQIYKK